MDQGIVIRDCKMKLFRRSMRVRDSKVVEEMNRAFPSNQPKIEKRKRIVSNMLLNEHEVFLPYTGSFEKEY